MRWYKDIFKIDSFYFIIEKIAVVLFYFRILSSITLRILCTLLLNLIYSWQVIVAISRTVTRGGSFSAPLENKWLYPIHINFPILENFFSRFIWSICIRNLNFLVFFKLFGIVLRQCCFKLWLLIWSALFQSPEWWLW